MRSAYVAITCTAAVLLAGCGGGQTAAPAASTAATSQAAPAESAAPAPTAAVSAPASAEAAPAMPSESAMPAADGPMSVEQAAAAYLSVSCWKRSAFTELFDFLNTNPSFTKVFSKKWRAKTAALAKYTEERGAALAMPVQPWPEELSGSMMELMAIYAVQAGGLNDMAKAKKGEKYQAAYDSLPGKQLEKTANEIRKVLGLAPVYEDPNECIGHEDELTPAP